MKGQFLRLGAAAVIVALALMRRQKKKTGTFLGIPYDWRRPSWSLVRERMWNPADSRVFTPHVFGWGWSINIPTAWNRLRQWVSPK